MIDKPFVCFDLDDTVIDWTVNTHAAGLEACERLATAHQLDADVLHTAFRTHADAFWLDPARAIRGRRDLVAASAEIMSIAAQAIGANISADSALEFSRHYRALRDGGGRLRPEHVAVLETLRGAGAKLALITNGNAADQRRKLAQFELTHHFDVIAIEGEFGVGKPDARVFRHVLDTLGAREDSTVMVGDDLYADIGGARRLGIEAIWVDVVGDGLPANAPAIPDRIIRSIAELLD